VLRKNPQPLCARRTLDIRGILCSAKSRWHAKTVRDIMVKAVNVNIGLKRHQAPKGKPPEKAKATRRQPRALPPKQ